MGWAFGENDRGEPVGYGIPDTCNQDGCEVDIDRGLAYCCGNILSAAFSGDGPGCGRYFCSAHLYLGDAPVMLCEACVDNMESGADDSGIVTDAG